jgi:hypothetical protein
MQDMNNTMSQLNDQNILLRAQLSASSGGNNINDVANHNGNFDNNQIVQLQNQVQLLTQENSHQKTQISFYESENVRLLEELNQLKLQQFTINNVENKSSSVEHEAKIDSLKKDQENLLELLSDQDLKLKEYRRQLRSLGQQIEDSDDES